VVTGRQSRQWSRSRGSRQAAKGMFGLSVAGAGEGAVLTFTVWHASCLAVC
jgi:hypothetical protein